jgi:hypothetical protein
VSSVPHIQTHVMKVGAEEFQDIHTGKKTFLVTLLLENMKVGDHVLIKEFTGGVYNPTRSSLKQITYIQHLTSNLYVIALNSPYEFY